MNLKFNLGILNGKYVIFDWLYNGRHFKYEGEICSVKSKKNYYMITFTNGYKIKIADYAITKCRIKEVDDDKLSISYDPLNEMLSGFVGFSMSDTYGFPIEMTKEILDEDGFEIDMDGYYVLRRLQKQLSAGTYKNKDGWNGK